MIRNKTNVLGKTLSLFSVFFGLICSSVLQVALDLIPTATQSSNTLQLKKIAANRKMLQKLTETNTGVSLR